jgi:hypothetical protein
MVKRTTNNATVATLVASSVTNQDLFTLEDFKGNVVSNSNPNRYVVGLKMQFFQLRYPVAIGSNGIFDWYQVQTKVAKRDF